MISKSRITAVGGYVPDGRLTNSDFEKMVDTSDDWIVQRTGIRERRIAETADYASDLALRAVRNLVETTGKTIDDVDMILVSTFTADYLTPSLAAVLQGFLGLPDTVGVLDVNAACAGYAWALLTANAYVSSGMCRKVLVVAAEVMSKIMDYTDRNTCVLFGDGAAAMLVERDEGEGAFLGCHYGADGSMADRLYCTSLSPRFHGTELIKHRLFWQDGRAVYNFTIRAVPVGVRKLLENAGITADAVDWFVPHSANVRIIESIAEKVGIPMEKTLLSLEYFGNTSSATIPLAIWLAEKEKRIKKGDLLLLYGFGGGLNHAGTVIRW